MNSGTAGPTSATVEQQNIAMQQMQNYWKQQIPALNYVAQSTTADQPGVETMAAGQGAAAGRAAGTVAAERGAVSGRGTVVGNVGKGLYMGANDAAQGAAAARGDSRGLYYGRQLGVVQGGNQILSMANKGLITAGGTSTDEANAVRAGDQQRQQAALQSTAALAAAFI